MRFTTLAATAALAVAPVGLASVAAIGLAAQAQAQASHTVFFALDSSRIDAENMAIVERAAAEFAATGTTAVSIVGHTDTTGSREHNMRLSQRRAESVASALAARGVPADAVTLAWRGQDDLAVPTADNVLEPRNRRAEITIDMPAAAPAPAPAPMAAAPLGVTLGAGPFIGYNLENGDNSWLLGGQIIARYAVTPNVDLTGEGAVFYNTDANDDGWGGRIAAGADYVFNEVSGVRPFVGASGGHMWIDGSGTGGFLGGPRIGVKAGDIEARVQYDFVESRSADEGVISLSVNYNFFTF